MRESFENANREGLPPGSLPSIRLDRGIRVIRVTSWISLLLGVLVTASGILDSGLVVAASILGAIYSVAATITPLERWVATSPIFHMFSLAAALVTVAAVALTGGPASPFVLLAMMPGLLAAMIGGFRFGLSTSVFSAVLIAVVTVADGGVDGLLASGGVIGLFPLMALLVAQIRSLLIEAEERASALERVTADAEARLLRLEQANEMLRRLTDLYGEGSTNPVDVGRSAIETIVDSYPGSFATATLFDRAGPVVVARAGTDSSDLIRTQIPLGYGPTTSGVVSIGTPEPMTPNDLDDIDRLLQPVGVSFANAVLVQGIAGEAIREERLRLARELHDEIGPALSAVGLSLDGATMQILEEEPRENVAEIRTSLGSVVDDLRAIISDLRAEESGSLLAALRSALADFDAPPDIRIDIHELRPPRVAAGRQMLAIVTEAARNAHRHAGATTITVEGTVNRSEAEIAIRDDGSGFDPNHLPDGHYGIMGMRERADRIGATMEIISNQDGTLVRVSWKEDR